MIRLSKLFASCYYCINLRILFPSSPFCGRKHLLHRFNADGKIVEHGTGTQFNCKEFVQSSEKTQMKASESSFNQPDNSSSTSQSNGIRLGSPSQWIPRSHTSLEPLPMVSLTECSLYKPMFS